MKLTDKIRKVEDMVDVAETLSLAVDAMDAAFHVKKKITGRPPKVKREHIRALYRILVSIVEDLDDMLERLSPDPKQVCILVDAVNKLVDMRRIYTVRINSLENLGVVPEELLKGTEYDESNGSDDKE